MLIARGLTKRIPSGAFAVDHVDLTLAPGELLAVCGANGAGKTTLLKMMVGLLAPDAGQLVLDGVEIAWRSPAAARAHGVSMVEQHLALALELDAVENTALLAGAWLTLERAAIAAALAASAAELGIDVALDVPVGQLDVGQRQKIELLRALRGSGAKPRVLVLDEPTAVLLPHEAEALYAMLRTLVQAGTCVVVVTHRLGEVSRHADRVVVLTRGKKVHDAPFDRQADSELQLAPIAKAVFAEHVRQDVPPASRARLGEAPVFTARELGAGRLQSASFALHPGEIVGIAGVEGNGQRELFELLTGRREAERGSFDGKTTRAFVVADRHDDGLLLDASLADNVLLGDHRSFGLMLRPAVIRAEAARRLEPVMPQAGLERLARELSGGNQQKLVLARALSRAEGAPFLLLAEPTRGVDVGAQAEIHRLLRELAGTGMPLLILSSDLDELRALCTSLFVLERGVLLGPFDIDVPDEILARAMMGLAAG